MKELTSSESDRRQFRRVQAPVYCRPAGLSFKSLTRQKPIDISLGGLRIYSDDDVKKGTRLELELFLPDTSSVVCRVEVAWVERLPAGALARYDVGLKFVEIKNEDHARLQEVLEREGG
jgi:c-di-GMP-binding flagellar brake protein YcgR